MRRTDPTQWDRDQHEFKKRLQRGDEEGRLPKHSSKKQNWNQNHHANNQYRPELAMIRCLHIC